MLKTLYYNPVYHTSRICHYKWRYPQNWASLGGCTWAVGLYVIEKGIFTQMGCHYKRIYLCTVDVALSMKFKSYKQFRRDAKIGHLKWSDDDDEIEGCLEVMDFKNCTSGVANEQLGLK